MATARKPRPVTPSRRRSMGEFLRDMLDGAIVATDVHITTVPDGTQPSISLEFVPDPRGPFTIPQDSGRPLVGRFDRIVTRIPRNRIVGFEYTDPDGPGERPRRAIDRRADNEGRDPDPDSEG